MIQLSYIPHIDLTHRVTIGQCRICGTSMTAPEYVVQVERPCCIEGALELLRDVECQNFSPRNRPDEDSPPWDDEDDLTPLSEE